MPKSTMTVSKVQAALARAIESTQWARQSDDAEALCHLQKFLNSQHTKNMFYMHLLTEQEETPEVKSDTDDLDIKVLAHLYSYALDGGPAGSITSAIFRNHTPRGSSMYELNYNSPRAIRFYVRRCRGELRGELNEDTFGVNRNIPQPHQEPRSVTHFLKKVWNNIL